MIGKYKRAFYLRICNYVELNHPNPYIVEYFMMYPKIIEASFVTIIGMIILTIFCYLTGEIQFIDYTPWDLVLCAFLVIFICICFVPLLYGIFTSPVLKGILWEKLSGESLVKENMSIENIYVCSTTAAFQKWEEDVPYIIDKFYPEEFKATPAVLLCKILPYDVVPKSSNKKYPFQFYGESTSYFDPKKCSDIFLIMTRQKSDLLDRLIELEPTAEFEITYLKYSRQFQKIQPIPGWEYADGVQELCDEISNMYP